MRLVLCIDCVLVLSPHDRQNSKSKCLQNFHISDLHCFLDWQLHRPDCVSDLDSKEY